MLKMAIEIVSFPMKMVDLSIVMLVYQRVMSYIITILNQPMVTTGYQWTPPQEAASSAASAAQAGIGIGNCF